jgi:hypothetical protein
MDETASPITLDEIKTAVKARHDVAVVELQQARTERDKMNAKIKLLAAEEAESARILRTVEGRKTKAK